MTCALIAVTLRPLGPPNREGAAVRARNFLFRSHLPSMAIARIWVPNTVRGNASISFSGNPGRPSGQH